MQQEKYEEAIDAFNDAIENSGRMFEAVGSTPIHLISQASDVSVSFLVDQEYAPAVVQRIHDRLVECRSPEPRPAGLSEPPRPSTRRV